MWALTAYIGWAPYFLVNGCKNNKLSECADPRRYNIRSETSSREEKNWRVRWEGKNKIKIINPPLCALRCLRRRRKKPFEYGRGINQIRVRGINITRSRSVVSRSTQWREHKHVWSLWSSSWRDWGGGGRAVANIVLWCGRYSSSSYYKCIFFL